MNASTIRRALGTISNPATSPDVRSRWEAMQRTGSRAGHDTVWGDADALLACIAWVVPVEGDEETR